MSFLGFLSCRFTMLEKSAVSLQELMIVRAQDSQRSATSELWQYKISSGTQAGRLRFSIAR